MRNMRKFKDLLAALEGACRGVSEEVRLISIDYSRGRTYKLEASVHVAPKEFEVGRLPIERLQHRPGEYPWRMECKIENVTIKSFCTDEDIVKMPIGDDTEISPEAARYLRFLMMEKERKEREASGVAGN